MEKVVGKYSLVVIYVFMCVGLEQAVSELRLATFTKEVTCKLQERLDFGLAELKSGEVSGLVKCAAACVDQCSGVSVDEDNNCYHHKDSNETISCFANDVLFQFYRKNPCENDGVWDPVGLTCQCVGGWVGGNCERYPRNCREIHNSNTTTHIPTFIQVENFPAPLLVYCSYHSGTNTSFTYIFKNHGAYYKTPTWEDYVHGFYHDYTSYWIGLEKIKALNDAGLTIVNLRCMNLTKSFTYLHTFKNFSIGPVSTGYSITLSHSKSQPNGTTFADCLSQAQGVPFSNTGHGNVEGTALLTRARKAGWWLRTYDVDCNPLGPKPYWKMAGLNLGRGNFNLDMYFQDV